MDLKRASLALALLAFLSAPGHVAAQRRAARSADETISRFTVRPGYTVTLAAEGFGETRFLEFDDRGTLFVSQPSAGRILALRDENADGVYEKHTVFVDDHATAHGMHWKDGWLWFTQTGAVHKARDTDADGKADEIVTVIPEGHLPSGGGHWWRSILVTADSIYTSIGDSGNISDESKTERQKILRFDLDGKNKRVFASGLRNTEKLRLRPGTQEVWGVDHGSDWFGGPLGEKRGLQPVTDHNPPDEFNRYVEGAFYGHPFVTGNRLPRYEFRDRRDILDLAARTTSPEWLFGAHWAANGWTFLDPALCAPGRAMPPSHAGDAFVACRGSWNRSVRDGYCVVRVLFDDHSGKPYGMLPIVRTMSPDASEVFARPVDCAHAPDGAVLFSCDTTSRVYRITHAGPTPD